MNEEKHSLRVRGLCFDTGIICRRNGQCLGCCKYAKKRKNGKMAIILIKIIKILQISEKSSNFAPDLENQTII
jgi:hypothetical protein